MLHMAEDKAPARKAIGVRNERKKLADLKYNEIFVHDAITTFMTQSEAARPFGWVAGAKLKQAGSTK